MGQSFINGDGLWKFLGMMAYACTSCTMLSASAVCHHYSWNWDWARQLSAIDYMGISVMIAGAYIPPCLALGCFGTLGFVWSLAILGTALDFYKVSRGDLAVSATYRGILIGRFLLMGWAVAPSVPLIFHLLPAPWLWLTLAGGLTYTLGVPVFLSAFEFHLPIWHTFVLAATACMFIANFLYIAGTSAK